VRLTDALRLRPGMSVAFTGAGGKSSALETLAREAVGDFPIILTTTTRLGIAQRSLGDEHVQVATAEEAGRLAISGARRILVTAGEDRAQGKLLGLEARAIAEVARRAHGAGALLAIEADGARGRWLKAPAEHEPVVPEWVDVVVPVAGLHAIGSPLTQAIAHRPDRIARVLGLQEAERLSASHLAELLSSPRGGLQGIPDSAEVRVLLTGADSAADESVREVEAGLLESTRVRAVLSGELGSSDPVRSVGGRVAGIVLAGGAGERFGGPKQVALWRGKPLISYAIRAAAQAGLSPIVVVVGAEGHAVQAVVKDEDVVLVENPDWRNGQSTTVHAGLSAVEQRVEAAVFLLADMPRVGSKTTRRLVEAHRLSLPAIVAPVGGGRRGNPVLFDRRVFPTLHALEGDQGGRSLLHRFPWEAIEADPEEFFEVDRPEDLETLESGR
jgi:molybdenum cofactor cytidylyltransferase